MAATSFRDILSQFLEEESSNSPLKNEPPRHKSSENVEFPWGEILNFPRSEASTAKRNGYPPPPERPKRVEMAPPPPPPKPAEPSWSVEQLSSTDQLQVRELIKMGARELENGISLSKLKKAHRRLAKQLHPDALGNDARKADFVRLQSIYDVLNRSLKALSESACGSESASAAGSPHRAAA